MSAFRGSDSMLGEKERERERDGKTKTVTRAKEICREGKDKPEVLWVLRMCSKRAGLD